MRPLIAVLTCLTAFSTLAAESSPKIKLEPLVRGLQNPLYLTHDGTQRIFIVEQVGRIRLFENGQLQKTPYLDIKPKVLSGGECGLLGLAFHPKFAENGYFYVNYTARRGKLITVISEFRADPSANRVNPATERVLL